MVLKVLKDIVKDINKSDFFLTISDKVTHSGNNEEFVIYFSLIDEI